LLTLVHHVQHPLGHIRHRQQVEVQAVIIAIITIITNNSNSNNSPMVVEGLLVEAPRLTKAMTILMIRTIQTFRTELMFPANVILANGCRLLAIGYWQARIEM
jgi:hypothetical protein